MSLGAFTPGLRDNVLPKQEGVSCLALACLDVCERSNHTPMQNKTTKWQSPNLDSGALEQFACSVNAANPATAANSFDICCLATGRSPVNVGNTVLYCIGRSVECPVPIFHLLFIKVHNELHYFSVWSPTSAQMSPTSPPHPVNLWTHWVVLAAVRCHDTASQCKIWQACKASDVTA